MATRRGVLRGVVQGVGFRPFVAGLARELELRGRVANRGGQVEILIDGDDATLDRFVDRLQTQLPPAARVDAASWEPSAAKDLPPRFEIAASDGQDDGLLAVGPDLRLCDACAREVDDPDDRRCGYALTTCTGCGPRLTLATRSPWTRANSAMASFEPCPACVSEFEDPSDRRWHAEAITCPRCGPSLWLEGLDGRRLAEPGEAPDDAIQAAAELLRRGQILGVQGMGGFTLLVDARAEPAVARLRARKRRPSKPLALMVRDLRAAAELAVLSPLARATLASAAGPIVLLPRAPGPDPLAPGVAPGQPRLGLMLPSTAAHALLLDRFKGPVVATSGNVHGQAIARTVDDARTQLGEVADALLVHDRPILRRCDDSVVQLVDGEVRVLRLARGLAPARFELGGEATRPTTSPPIVALGGHLQQAPALAVGDHVLAWPHVGDLDDPRTRAAMAESVEDMCALIGRRPQIIACDAHPDYATSIWAQAQGQAGARIERVFHHHAHVAAVLAEHGRDRALGVAWDGAGFGPDRSSWGGEFLEVGPEGARRLAGLLPFPLPGGDAAARDGFRSLAGMARVAELSASAVTPLAAEPGATVELETLIDLARRPRLSPTSSAVGRLFDAFAALLGLRRHSEYQAQAARELEHAAARHGPAAPYPFGFTNPDPNQDAHAWLDWRPMLREACRERDAPTLVAARVHATLIAMIVAVVQRHRPTTVALSGGCFANAILLTGARAALSGHGVETLAPRRLPPGDGGLAVGQAWVVRHRILTRPLTRPLTPRDTTPCA